MSILSAKLLPDQIMKRQWHRRVPIVLQMNAIECGAACLAMILGYYGRKTTVTECRALLNVGRDGVTAQTIAQEARRFGLRVRAYSLQESFTDFKYIQLPAIVHWDFNHFIVVERWSSQTVTIVDPIQGRISLKTTEFEQQFTGVVLTLSPSTQFNGRSNAVHHNWQTYLKHMLSVPGTIGLLGQIIGASLLLQLFGLLLPFVTQIILDRILPFRLTNVMPMLGVGMLIFIIAQTTTSYLRSTLLIYLQAHLDTQMMFGFFEHLLSLPFRFFQERNTGDLIMRLSSNTTIRETMTGQTMSIILDGAFILIYLCILLGVEPLFGLLVLIIGGLQILLIRGTLPKVHGLVQRDLIAQAQSQSYLVEALSGIQTLKASGTEDRIFDHWSNLFFKQLNISIERQHLANLIETLLSALRAASPLILLWVGVYQVLSGSLTVGTMLALNALAASFLSPLMSLITNLQRLQVIGAHLQRLADVMEAEPEQEVDKVESAPKLNGRIHVDNISFQYNNDAAWILKNISIDIQSGQKVALVGRTGSGKSTLAKLLLGLYQPTKGTITYNDIALDKINYQTLRRQMGVVLQESFLFSGSIRENITFNNPDLPLLNTIKAAQQAAIHKDIMQMPMGYETRVAEGGSGLSGGQRQRLSLARALANNPAILILDEATSHLDVVTEQIVSQHLNELACTRIVIAHRLSTVQDADLILVLDEGKLIEQGTHDQLLAQSGYYTHLIQNQLNTGITA